MDNLALQLARQVGSGPSDLLRAELRSIFNYPALSTLNLNLELFETLYRVLGSTPNLLSAELGIQYQIILILPDESTGWEPVKKPNRSTDQRPIPTLYHRISDDGVLHFKIEILDSTSDQGGIGVIAATAPLEALTNLQLLQTLERLAVALSKHSSILLDFNSSVGKTLFGTSHPPNPSLSSSEDLEDSEDEEEMDEDNQTQRSNSSSLSIAGGILSIWTHGFSLHNSRGGASNGASGGELSSFHPFTIPGRSGAIRHVTAGQLTFTNLRDEAHFQRWHARHMLQFDVCVLSMCVLFHTMLVFTTMGRVTIFKAVAPWRWVVGYVQLALLLFLTNKTCRLFYIRHRDEFLLGLIAIMLFYHHFVMRNFLGMANALQKCSGVVYCFLWIPFTTLILQARFKWLMPAMVLTTAINLTLLGDICAASCDGLSANTIKKCLGLSSAKVALMVGSALCTVYCVEYRARRVWASLQGPTRQS